MLFIDEVYLKKTPCASMPTRHRTHINTLTQGKKTNDVADKEKSITLCTVFIE